MGLGPLSAITLADARAMAEKCRRQRVEGVDPIEARNAERSGKQIAAARTMTFDQCAAAYVASHSDGWRNPKHAAQWKSTLSKYASPVFGSLPVQAVDVALVMKALEAIWAAIPETAERAPARPSPVWPPISASRAFITSATSTACTGSNPNTGLAYFDSVLFHCAACFGFRHPSLWETT